MTASAPDYTVEPIAEGAIFTIERPAKLNALTKPVLLGLAATLDALEAGGARLLVVTGRGERAFCAGTDLGELQGLDMAARMAKTSMARDLLVRLSRSPLVSVAAVNGLAYGGGLELAMACTLRIAAPHDGDLAGQAEVCAAARQRSRPPRTPSPGWHQAWRAGSAVIGGME